MAYLLYLTYLTSYFIPDTINKIVLYYDDNTRCVY